MDFFLLQDVLTEPPVLKLPKWHKPFSIDTDVCDGQIGCALFQLDNSGMRKLIGLWSRSLCDREMYYSSTESECLAVVWAVQMLRPYIERRHFTLYTDHLALKWLFDLLDTYSAPRLPGLRLRLPQSDNFAVRYGPGPDNQVADAISRLPAYGFEWQKTDDEIPCVLIDGCCQQNSERIATLNTKIDHSGWCSLDWEAGDTDSVEENDTTINTFMATQWTLLR